MAFAGALAWSAMPAAAAEETAPVARLPEAAPAPDGFQLSYDVYRGGMRLLRVDLDIGLDGDAYRTRTALQTTGVVGFFFDWKFSALSEGERSSGALRPARYRTFSRSGSRQRSVEVVWRDGVAAEVVAEPPYGEDAHRAVGPAQRAGVQDPMSAVTAVILTNGARDCRQRAAVFDGRRRYDARLQPLGERRLEPSAYAPFAGMARGCRLRIDPVAGFDDDGSHLTEIDAEIWLADVGAGSGPVPVRLRLDTPWGWGFAHLSQARDASGRLVFGASEE